MSVSELTEMTGLERTCLERLIDAAGAPAPRRRRRPRPLTTPDGRALTLGPSTVVVEARTASGVTLWQPVARLGVDAREEGPVSLGVSFRNPADENDRKTAHPFARISIDYGRRRDARHGDGHFARVAIKPTTLDEFVMEVFRTPDGATYLARPAWKDHDWPYHGPLEPTDEPGVFRVGPHPRE